MALEPEAAAPNQIEATAALKIAEPCLVSRQLRGDKALSHFFPPLLPSSLLPSSFLSLVSLDDDTPSGSASGAGMCCPLWAETHS